MELQPFRAVIYEEADFQRRFVVPIWVSYIGAILLSIWLGSMTANPISGVLLIAAGLCGLIYAIHRSAPTPSEPTRRYLEIDDEEVRIYLQKDKRLIDNYTLRRAIRIGVERRYSVDDVLLDRRLRWVNHDTNVLVLEMPEGRHQFRLIIAKNEMLQRLDRLVREWRRFDLPVEFIERKERGK